MAHRTIVVDSLAYEFAPDDPPALADRLWSLLQGRAIDEITGEPVAALEASVAEPELGVRTGEGGTYTVFARPWHRFPPLAAAGYPLHLTIAADGYIATTQVATIPSHQRLLSAPAPAIGANVITLSSNAGLVMGQRLLIGPAGPDQESRTIASVGPGANQVTLAAAVVNAHAVGSAVVADEFAPVAVADILMHRAPVTIGGRSVRRNASGIGTTPVANASIAVQGLWRTAQDVRQHLPAAAAATVSLAPGLYAPRAVGAALAAQDLPAVTGDDKLLIDQTSSGDSFIGISNRLNLVAPPLPPPYSVLRIDAGTPEATEYIGLAGGGGLGGANEAGRVALDHALLMPHRRDALIQLIAPQPAAVPKFFADAGAPGDTCVFLSDIAGLDTADTVAITGGAAPASTNGSARSPRSATRMVISNCRRCRESHKSGWRRARRRFPRSRSNFNRTTRSAETGSTSFSRDGQARSRGGFACLNTWRRMSTSKRSTPVRNPSKASAPAPPEWLA